jgi:hypothetical protein
MVEGAGRENHGVSIYVIRSHVISPALSSFICVVSDTICWLSSHLCDHGSLCTAESHRGLNESCDRSRRQFHRSHVVAVYFHWYASCEISGVVPEQGKTQFRPVKITISSERHSPSAGESPSRN